MRFLFGVLFIVSTLSACGGYSVSGNTVTFKRCSENGCITTTVAEAEPQSFEALRGDYAKDRHHVYFSGAPVREADPQSFKVLSDTYAKDNARAYFENKPIPGSDSRSFVALSDLNYGRDKNDIYILGSAVGACDPTSFQWLKNRWQVDSKCAYWSGTKLSDAHVESFIVLNEWYAKDSEHVFSSVSHKAIEGADSPTFRLAEGPCSVCARDKSRCYNAGAIAACDLQK
jgi:hypothetical protein